MSMASENTLLEIENLTVTFDLQAGNRITVLNDVSLSVARGETLGVVGESGCGQLGVLRPARSCWTVKTLWPLTSARCASAAALIWG